MIYCYALLPRSGLGNRLFPWSRCKIFSHINNIQMLSPDWMQIALGPLLRRESDLRFYHNLFKTNPDEIGKFKKLWLLVCSKKEEEPRNFLQKYKINENKGNIIVKFSGLRSYFEGLNQWNDFLYEKICEITQNKWLKIVEELIINIPPIGIHVRRGDSAHFQPPIKWFINSLETGRSVIGYPIDAFVVSDGKKKELKDLLNINNIDLIKSGSAISDLLVLSNAKILIASSSSFSSWASFLGQMPTICYPGHSLEWFNLKNINGFYLGDFNPSSPPKSLVKQITALF